MENKIVVNFNNIISELEIKGLKICFLKNRGIFIIDSQNNMYQKEINTPSYLDELIKKGITVEFNYIDASISKNIGEWEKEIWEVSEVKNFIKRQNIQLKEIINIKNLSDSELVKAYKEVKQNFLQAIEGTPEEQEADRIYTELSKELNERNIDLRDYQEESNDNIKENSGMTNMTMKETIRKILVRATNKGNIKTIAEVKYFINSDNNILMKIPLRGQKGNARITIFQDGSSTVGQFGKDFKQVDVNISKDIKHVIYKVFIDGVCKYTYEDFGEDKAIDRIKSQLKDKEYTLLQVI